MCHILILHVLFAYVVFQNGRNRFRVHLQLHNTALHLHGRCFKEFVCESLSKVSYVYPFG